MANLVMCGFEWGSAAGVNEITPLAANPGSIFITSQRSGSYCYGVSNSAYGGYFDFTASNEIYLQSAIRFSEFPTSEMVFFKWCAVAGVTLGTLTVTTSGIVKAYTGDSSTLVGTGTIALPVNVYRLIEMRLKIDNSSGVITTKIDSVQDINFSGDTQPGDDTTISRVYLTCTSAMNYNNLYFDDVFINDTTGSYNNSWPNNVKIVLLQPTADGTTKNWTCSTGTTHYSMVNETSGTATDYIFTASSDTVDEFVVENLPAEATAVRAIRVDSLAFRGSSNEPNQLKQGFLLAGGTYFSDAFDLQTTSTLVSSVRLEENPLTTAVFTPSNINDLQLTLKSS